MLEKYMNQDLNHPRYLFHGSPKFLENIEAKKSHDSNGNEHNIDIAVFVTPSFLLATAYAFKDKIKEVSLNSGLEYSFSINHELSLPIMKMENVLIPETLEGYIYVFEYNEKFINDPNESLQYKSYDHLKPIDVLKIDYNDFSYFYELNQKTR
ncbi:MAG: hypothetical protein PHY08_12205 [Candidatus Cloacimonetes bacterium]|nr:hypothetical protein [Candidatus Cloacimonadota bacterium]